MRLYKAKANNITKLKQYLSKRKETTSESTETTLTNHNNIRNYGSEHNS